MMTVKHDGGITVNTSLSGLIQPLQLKKH